MDSESDYHQFNEALSTVSPDQLTIAKAKRVVEACNEDKRFNIVEVRADAGDLKQEVIVVDCHNDQVPTKNTVGIRYVERLALRFTHQPNDTPEVFALRKDFPITPHQMAPLPEGPVSLCLYAEPWVTVERGWTAQKHLERCCIWLADTAAGDLHRADQPVEPFFFRSPWEVVLPPTVRQEGLKSGEVLYVVRSEPLGDRKGMLLARIGSRSTPQNGTKVSTAVITVSPVVGGVIERPATTLGALQEHLARRGSDLIKPLVDELRSHAGEQGVRCEPGEFGLLIVRIPIQRSEQGDIEAVMAKGFLLEHGLGAVGGQMGVLQEQPKGVFQRFDLLTGNRYDLKSGWESTVMDPLAVIDAIDAAGAQRLTGVVASTANFSGVLIGSGSLGSQLGVIWAKEAWGRWTVIDHDLVKPHNGPRHQANADSVGRPKADVTCELLNRAAPPDSAKHTAIVASAPETESTGAAAAALDGADLIVDVSTTLHVPRDLSQRSLKRLASAFLTPSGQACALLIEDEARDIKLDALEAQYYRTVIRAAWGEQHLAGHLAKKLWVGAGCREATTVLAPDQVSMFAGLIARRLRLHRDENSGLIGVWTHDDKTGAIAADVSAATTLIEQQRGEWRVVWDEQLEAELQARRQSYHPHETGGVLVGYIDHVLQAIYIVDALPATADSVGTPGSFERGTDGLKACVDSITDKTGGVVGYIGEWHSHPKGLSADPSGHDLSQLTFVTRHLRQEGSPGLMLIVGEDGARTFLGEVVSLDEIRKAFGGH